MSWETIINPKASAIDQFGGVIINRISQLYNDIDVGADYRPTINTIHFWRPDKLYIVGQEGTYTVGLTTPTLTKACVYTIPETSQGSGVDEFLLKNTSATVINKTFSLNNNIITATGAAWGHLVYHNGTGYINLPIGTTNKSVLAITGDPTINTIGWMQPDSSWLSDNANIVKTNQANNFGDFNQEFIYNRLRVKNLAGDAVIGFAYLGTVNRTLQIPALSATDTVATRNLDNAFTIAQYFQTGTVPQIRLRNSSTAVNGLETGLDFISHNSASINATYVRIRATHDNVTQNSEAGTLDFMTRHAGAFKSRFRFQSDGLFSFGENLRAILSEAGLSAARTYTFPDATTQLAGRSVVNTFTAIQNISVDTHYPLTVRRTATNAQGPGIAFYHRNVADIEKTLYYLSARWSDSTDGQEDGALWLIGKRDGADVNHVFFGGGTNDIGLYNSAGTFYCAIRPSAFTTNFAATIPVLTANDTFAFKGINNNFTTPQSITVSGNDALFTVHSTNLVGSRSGIYFALRDSANNTTAYGGIYSEIMTNTDLSEEGSVVINLRSAGGWLAIARVETDGLSMINKYKILTTGLTAFRSFTLPNQNGRLLVDTETDIVKTGQTNTYGDFLQTFNGKVLIKKTSGTGDFEEIFELGVTDSGDYIRFQNGASTAGVFAPYIVGAVTSTNALATHLALHWRAIIKDTLDSGSIPAIRLEARNSVGAALITRPLAAIANVNTDEYIFYPTYADFTGNELRNTVIHSTVTGIKNVNIAADAVIDITKLAPGTTSGHVLTWNGSAIVWAAAPGSGGGSSDTASNLGTGIAVFKQKTSGNYEFKTLRSPLATVSISADVDGNHVNLEMGAHKSTHVVGGSDPFVSADVLDASIRYIVRGSDPTNDRQVAINGTSHKLKYRSNSITHEVVNSDDARLSDARTPTAHTHPLAEITDANTLVTLTGAQNVQDKTFNGYKLSLSTKTAGYTLVDTDTIILADATTAGFTLTLPAASTRAGKEYIIQKTDSTNNVVTIDANASELINGQTTFLLSAQYQVVTLRCNGTAWFVAPNSIERRGRATANGTGAQTTFTIAHGLGMVPHSCLAVCSSHPGMTYTRDATNITCVFSTAPATGTNNVIIEWSVTA